MLHEESNDLPDATADHVTRVAEKDGTFDFRSIRGLVCLRLPFRQWFIRPPPLDHFIDLLDGPRQMGGLEAGRGQGSEEGIVVHARAGAEIVPFANSSPLGHRLTAI